MEVLIEAYFATVLSEKPFSEGCRLHITCLSSSTAVLDRLTTTAADLEAPIYHT
jgi:hypothetical protein